MQVKTRCRCPLHRQMRKLQAVVFPKLDRRGRALIEHLVEERDAAEMDSTFWECKYKGTWPGDAE